MFICFFFVRKNVLLWELVQNFSAKDKRIFEHGSIYLLDQSAPLSHNPNAGVKYVNKISKFFA